MHKGLSLRKIFLILFILTGTTEAAQHNHHAEAINPVCDKQDDLPSLRCANAPSAVFDNNGRLWVAWEFGNHVYVNYSDDKGKSYSLPVAVNTVPEHIYAIGENRPKIVIGNRGRIYVSWTQKLEQRFSGHIRFSYSANNGKNFFDPVTVNDHKAVTSHRFDAMAVNERGDIYIAWLDKRDLLKAKKEGKFYNGAALYYAVSTDGGKSFNKNKKVIDYSCQCCRVVMAIDNDQLPVIVWRHIFGDNIRDHALVKFDNQMQAGKVQRVSYDNWQVDACPHHGPDISISKDGSYDLVWFNNAPQRHGLFYARTDDKGKSFSEPLNFGNYKAQAAHPQVLNKGDNVFLAWKEFDGKQSTLFMMRSSDAGKSWSTPHIIAKTAGGSDHPLLIADNKNVYSVWHRPGQDYQLFPLEGY